jgi:hypothetical protein
MKRILSSALFAATALFPVSALAQGNDCDLLIAFLEQNESARSQVTLEDARAMQTKQDADACRQALQQVNAEAGTAQQPTQAEGQQPTQAEGQPEGQAEGEQGANIVVQQPAPTITVDQPAPQISVQQTPPNVMVRQPQPEIVVHQPAPVITIDIPQPEITVRMPQPEVTVEQAPPQVSVQEAQPKVQVVQPEQPQVQVEQGGQAQVSLAQPEGAKVQVEQVGEAQVTYDREEPQVTINQAEGQPTIRVEQMEPSSGEAAGALRSTENANAEAQGQQQAAATQAGDASQPKGQAAGQMQKIAASDLEGMVVVNAKGEQIGTAEGLVQSAEDKKLYLVINQDGFLGLDKKQVALSLEGMILTGDKIVIPNVTDEQIVAFPAFKANDQFPEVDGNTTAEIMTAAE